MKLSDDMEARPRRWQKNAALGTVGLIAFAAAAFVGSLMMKADESEDGVVGSVQRIRPHVAQMDVASLKLAPSQSREPDAGAASRLSGQVTHNPFGAMNLGAGASTAVPVVAQASAVRISPASSTKTSAVKPPQPEPPRPPLPPVAPPLPFTAVGSIRGAELADGRPVAFIKQQEHLLVVRAGDVIGPSYRVESITAQAVEFIYLPLKQRQALALAP